MKQLTLEEFDDLMIRAIKQKLIELNEREKNMTENNPKFEWKCSKDCLWIAVKLLQKPEK